MKKQTVSVPSLSGAFAPWTNEGEIYDLVVHGEIPEDLLGTFFRNGPNPQFVLNAKHHIFDGDGMVHAFEFSTNRVRYYNKWVRTEKFSLERAAGRSLFGGMANRWKDPSVQDRSGNVANTNVVWHGHKLLALFEAGFPVELDPETLDTIGIWTFRGELDRAMTAHPKIDPKTGDLLFYSHVFGQSRELMFYRADSSGKIVESRKIPTPFHSMIHDFAITQNFTIIPIFPLTLNMEKAAKGLSPIEWNHKLGTHFGLCPRNGNGAVIWIKTEACFAFHFLNAYEEDGKVIIDAIAADTIPEDAAPFQGEVDDFPTRLVRWTLDCINVSAEKVVLDTTRCELPRIDERYLGQKHQHGYFVGQLQGKGGDLWNAIVHFDFQSKTKRIFSVPGQDIVNEAVFVPKQGGHEGEGYLLSLVYRSQENRSDLLVLDAQHIDEGPLATVEIPHRVPFGFHGCWKPS